MADWYARPLRIDRGVKLYMNDYSILSGGGKNTAKQDYYYQLIQDIEAQGGTIHGIGMQGHFATELTPIERLYEIVDRFAQLGKEIKVTEFDISTDQRDVQAEYTRDFMTILFSHPSVKAILGWGFVASSHWKPDAALYDADWTIRPNGLMWKKMIYEEWWTPEQTGQSDASGKYRFEGYLGTYSYEIAAGDSIRTGTFILDQSHASGSTDSLIISMDEGVVEELVIHPSEEGFICEGEEISLAVPHMEGFSYAWTLNGEAIAADTSQITAARGGLYSVRAQRGDLMLEALPYELELRNAPQVEIGLEGEASLCPGERGKLSVLSGGDGQVEWYRGIQRVQWGGESFETEQSGIYYATLTSGACTARSNELTLEALPGTDPACTVSVETQGLEASRIYPNPCKGRLMVELPCAMRGGELSLYDASGQLRKRQALEEGSQLHELHIPSPGLYLLRIRSGQDEFTQRVISH